MLLKPQIIVLFAVVALSGMIVSPVSAYTEIQTYTLTNTTTNVYNYLTTDQDFYLTVANMTLAKSLNFTHLEWDGSMSRTGAGGSNSGTFTNKEMRASGPAGDICAYVGGSWSVPESVTFGPAHWEINIESWQNTGDADCNDVATVNYFIVDADATFPDDAIIKTTTANSGLNTSAVMAIRGASQYYPGEYTLYSGTDVIAPESGFTCTPTSQYPDENIVCTDTSTGPPSEWYWTIRAESVGLENFLTSTSQNFTWASHYPGLYSVNLWVNNSVSSDWENKTNYVSISANATPNTCYLPVASGYSRTLFQCTDTSTDAAISGCSIQLNDLEGNAWSNVTDRADGVWCIDTLPDHHINAYGQATGYSDGERINILEWNGITYTILMIPGYVPAAADGYVWVYVYVTDMDTSLSLPDAYVSISGSGLTTKSDYTDSSGSVHIQWPNKTTAYINVAKSGYTTGIKVIDTSDFGPDVTYVMLHKGTQTATITPTPGPGGVTTAATLGPYGTPGPGGTYAPGYVNNQGQMMMDLLATHGVSLVYLCILGTIFGIIGMMGKR